MKKYYENKTDFRDAKFVIGKNNKDKYTFKKNEEYSTFEEFIIACKYDLRDTNLFNLPNNIKISKNIIKKIKYNELTILPDYIWKQLDVETPIITNIDNTALIIEKNNKYKLSTKTRPFKQNKIGKIDYISDLHLDTKIPNNYSVYQSTIFIYNLLCKLYKSSSSDIKIFAGDISNNIILYKIFINLLSRFYGRKIIILGNHEFWNFNNIKKSIEFYKEITNNEKGIILLHNEVLCIKRGCFFEFDKINEKQLLNWSEKDKKSFQKSFDSYQYFILGGCGFSGLNTNFNAKDGLYRKCLDYKTDIIESNKFNTIFNRISTLAKNKSLIVISHTPYTNWHKGPLPNIDTNIFYVNGHTHSNKYEKINNNYIYSDNQIGYKKDIDSIKFKSVIFKEDYDYFYTFTNGIKEISYTEYLNFLRGKRISTDLTSKENYKLYLMRKNGYSMFIRESENGNLCLMYKGQVKKLPKKPIQYFYDNIDYSINKIKSPLQQFNNFLKEISKEIKNIGGYGSIHGQIIDIDFYNHLYVNPMDKQITPYYAEDIVHKIVYPTISLLLKDKNKSLYNNFVKLISSNALSVINSWKLPNIKKPEKYLETDIYKTNNIFHKFDLSIYEKVIGIWIEPEQDFYKITDIKQLPKK